ncbi:MAG: hypothetical protein HY742_10105 [Deltaproteobacteria bacterium]|nr:hypothetical protein [Deltaproteobacteria bacterium]
MNRHGSWKNILAMVSILIAISAALSGCAYNADLANVKPQLPDAAILDKLPLKAVVFIPESTRNYTQPTDVSSGCLAMHVTGNFGRIFAGTVEGTLKQVFEDLTVVKQPATGAYDILVEAAMTEYVYKAGCMGNPGSYGIVKGSIRALDTNGREIWRSQETSKRSSFTGSWQEFVPESMTSLVGAWAQDLTSQPEIRQLQKKTR